MCLFDSNDSVLLFSENKYDDDDDDTFGLKSATRAFMLMPHFARFSATCRAISATPLL